MHRSILHAVIIDCDNFEAGVAFWSAALGASEIKYLMDNSYAFLKGVPGTMDIVLQKVPEPKITKSRVHVDFATDNVEAEAARLEALGAKKTTKHEFWWTMNDPCGNEFCVVGIDHPKVLENAKVWE